MHLTRERLVEYLVDQHDIPINELSDETPLFTSHLLDSFAMVDLILLIENEEGIRVSATEVSLENMDTIGRILRYAEAKVSKSALARSIS